MNANDPAPTPSTICLDDYLKACGIVETGGQAKLVIQSGRVKLNGVVETRRRKKLVPGDVVHVDEAQYLVEED
ncbi:MAG: RNA-binding S4 domain-containing protein [Planctomycetaceae bacterium]